MFWGEGNDIYLDHEGSYMDVYVFQDSSNCTLKVDALAEKRGVCVKARREAERVVVFVGSGERVGQPEGGLEDL